MTNLFVAPTFLCAATQVAAIRAGFYGDSADNVLLVTNNSSIPEISDSLHDSPGFAALAEPFRHVAFLNDLISPFHPRSYRPDREGRALLRTDIEREFGIESFETVTVQSVHTRPSQTIFGLFPEARLSVISDGLMSYGPTRFTLSPAVSSRIERLLYLDLVPGLDPVLMSEFSVPRQIVPTEHFREVVRAYGEHVDGHAPTAAAGPVALVLGQYLAALNLVTEWEEEDLHIEMLRAAAAEQMSSIVFKAHPSAPPATTERLRGAASELGLELEILTTATPVEVMLGSFTPDCVIGSFSTGLSTAAGLFGIRALTVGAPGLAQRLPRKEDSNRVPLAISYLTLQHPPTDEGVPEAAAASSADLTLLVKALSRHMQPERYADVISDRETQALLGRRPDLREFFSSDSGDVTAEPAPGIVVPSRRETLVDKVRVASYRVERKLPKRLKQTAKNARARALPLK